MRCYIAMILLTLASSSFAQVTSPPANDSASHILQQTQRPLPPSIIAELRRSQKSRTLVYHDTLHAVDQERAHFNDSISQVYADSAISLVDTAVSLPQKAWLDSELVEIPELARLGTHVHYNYPPSLVMETDIRSISFDSTLVEHMNPVTRENLPYFDQSPLPMPMAPLARSESFLEAGAGNVSLPRLAGWLSQTISERSAMNIFGTYQSLDATQSAVHNFGNIVASLSTQLGEDPASEPYRSQELNVQGGYAVKNVAVANASKGGRAISQLSGRASMEGDMSKDFHYSARLDDYELSDGLTSGTAESSQDVALGTRFDVGNIRATIDGNYSLSSLFLDTNAAGASFFGGSSAAIHAQSVKALVGERMGAIEWYAGAEYLGGSGVDGSAISELMPVLFGRMSVNTNLSVGASFEPQEQLASLRELTNTNPFYAPELILQTKQNGVLIPAPTDGRSAAIDKINLAAFMNYALSADDELSIEARYITRDGEAVFQVVGANDSTAVFTVAPESTQRFIFHASGSFLTTGRDILTASAEFCSVAPLLPFETNAKAMVEYHFNSIWSTVQPSLAIQTISRTGATFTFLDANVEARLSQQMTLHVRIENILGSASDFWPGFSEKPRSIWATVRYTF